MSETASIDLKVSRRKLRSGFWPVSRDILIACVGLCGVALPPSAVVAQATSLQAPPSSGGSISSDDERLLAMNMGRYRISDDITAAAYNGGLCVDFQQVLTALDFPIIVDSARGAANGWFIRENQTFTLDLKSGRAEIAGRKVQIGMGSIGQLSSGACLTTDALKELLGVSFVYETNSAALIASSLQPLPLLQRLERQARSPVGAVSSTGGTQLRLKSLPYRMFVPPNSDVTMSYSASRSKEVKDDQQLSWSVLSVGELAFMTGELQLGGDREGVNGDISRIRLYRSDRDGGVFGRPSLTEVSFGDVSGYGSALGSIGGAGLGFSASTFPLNRPTSFDRTNFEGDLPAGWDVELYRNGQLLEFRNDGTTGSYSFKDVPVLFGDNNFDIVQYGPQGQRRVINRRINATTFLAPTGASFYRASIYRPEVAFAKTRPGSGIRVDLRSIHGVAENLNVGLGLDSYMSNGERLTVGSVAALTSVAGVALNGEIAGTSEGFFAGQVEFQGNGKGSGFRGRFIAAQDGFRTERFANRLATRFEVGADRGIIISNLTSGTLTGRVQFDRYHTGESLFSARQRFMVSRGNAWLSQSLTWSHSSSGERRDVIDGDIALSYRRGNLGLRASAEYGLYPNAQINRLSTVVERSFSVDPKAWRWRAEAGWSRNEDKFSYTLSAGRQFKAMNLDLFAETDGHDSHRFGVSLSFSLGRRAEGWGITHKPLATAGTVRAHLFEDLDDNGVFSTGDVPLAGASVQSANNLGISQTDANGYAIMDSMSASERAQINVLTDELIDSSLFARPTYTKPREGTVSEIAIPLTQMGSVEGTVTMAAANGDVNPIGGVALVLLDQSRREIARTTSAYDGFYSFDLVPTGNYSVEIAPDTSLATRLRPVEATKIATTRAEPGAQGLAMTLIESNPAPRQVALRGLL